MDCLLSQQPHYEQIFCHNCWARKRWRGCALLHIIESEVAGLHCLGYFL